MKMTSLLLARSNMYTYQSMIFSNAEKIVDTLLCMVQQALTFMHVIEIRITRGVRFGGSQGSLIQSSAPIMTRRVRGDYNF